MLVRNEVLTVVPVTASKCGRQGAWRALQHLLNVKERMSQSSLHETWHTHASWNPLHIFKGQNLF